MPDDVYRCADRECLFLLEVGGITPDRCSGGRWLTRGQSR
jgi:hypothetical protein